MYWQKQIWTSWLKYNGLSAEEREMQEITEKKTMDSKSQYYQVGRKLNNMENCSSQETGHQIK